MWYQDETRRQRGLQWWFCVLLLNRLLKLPNVWFSALEDVAAFLCDWRFAWLCVRVFVFCFFIAWVTNECSTLILKLVYPQIKYKRGKKKRRVALLTSPSGPPLGRNKVPHVVHVHVIATTCLTVCRSVIFLQRVCLWTLSATIPMRFAAKVRRGVWPLLVR